MTPTKSNHRRGASEFLAEQKRYILFWAKLVSLMHRSVNQLVRVFFLHYTGFTDRTFSVLYKVPLHRPRNLGSTLVFVNQSHWIRLKIAWNCIHLCSIYYLCTTAVPFISDVQLFLFTVHEKTVMTGLDNTLVYAFHRMNVNEIGLKASFPYAFCSELDRWACPANAGYGDDIEEIHRTRKVALLIDKLVRICLYDLLGAIFLRFAANLCLYAFGRFSCVWNALACLNLGRMYLGSSGFSDFPLHTAWSVALSLKQDGCGCVQKQVHGQWITLSAIS